jgi:hypothetical protein
MGTPRKGIPWLPEEDAALKSIWHSGERIKNHIHLFGDHSYAAIITHAHDIGLGKRQNCPRGQAPIAEKLMLRELGKGPVNRFKLADILQLDPSTTHKRLIALHRAGKVSISGWERRSAYSAMVPIYRVGKGEDAPKPPKRSNAENERRRRARRKEHRVMSGETVKTVNPFNTAMNQILQLVA